MLLIGNPPARVIGTVLEIRNAARQFAIDRFVWVSIEFTIVLFYLIEWIYNIFLILDPLILIPTRK